MIIPLQNCLSCGVSVDRAAEVEETVLTSPSPGDITVCVFCGHIMGFNDDLSLRELTDQEIDQIAGDERILHIQRFRTAVVKKKNAPLCYLATVYTKHANGLSAAFKDATRLVARLLHAGHTVYSPIAYAHPVAMFGGVDPLDHDMWIAFDAKMMNACDVLLVAQMDGWRESRGVAHEIEFFKQAEKPVRYLNCRTLLINDTPEEM